MIPLVPPLAQAEVIVPLEVTSFREAERAFLAEWNSFQEATGPAVDAANGNLNGAMENMAAAYATARAAGYLVQWVPTVLQVIQALAPVKPALHTCNIGTGR